uniref:Uncharacterized protein n=1 Tax=Romanomermis culicivorax TaxID=13658 RepID=A0A915JQP9_ROMCU
KSSGAKDKGPRAQLAYTKPRKTLIGILQVWGTGLLRDLQGLAKELALTGVLYFSLIFGYHILLNT